MAKLKSKSGACSSHTQGAKANCLKHNRREGKLASYVLADRTKDNITFYEAEDIRNVKTMKALQHRAEVEYTKLTGQKCQKSFTPYRESVLVVHDHVTPSMMEDYRKKAEAATGWRCVGLWYHKDEGYHRKKKKDGNTLKLNYHIHSLWDCQDHQTGKIIRPKSRKLFSQMQDILAECVGMERGEYAALTGKEHLDRNEFILQKQREEADSLQQKYDELTQQNTELQQRNVEISEELEKKEQEVQELKEQVGIGAKVGAFFGVGDLAPIHSELKEAKVVAIEAAKDKEAALKALKNANEAHGKELATVREESRQRGVSEALEAVKKTANLHITGKDGKVTAEDIGQNWRWNFDQRKQLQSKVDSLTAEKKQLQSNNPFEHLNKVLQHFHISTLNAEDVEKAAAVIDRSYLGGWNAPARNDFCDAVIAWGRQKRELSNNPSPKALQILRQLFEAMVEAWNYLMRVVRAPFKDGMINPMKAAELARYSFTPAAVMEEVQLQLELTPGAAECSDGWQEALKQTPDQFLAPYQSLVKLHSDIEHEQHDQEQHIEEEELEQKRNWLPR